MNRDKNEGNLQSTAETRNHEITFRISYTLRASDVSSTWVPANNEGDLD